jgi:hypothetical protein
LYRAILIGIELIEHEVRDQALIMLRHGEADGSTPSSWNILAAGP